MDTMSKSLVSGLFILWFLISISAADDECNCDEDGFWSLESIFACQKVSDFFIAVAYFSIPVELLYFISCSNVPFMIKWVIVEFIAFIVLCGMTHLLHGWTYSPQLFQFTRALTIFKILTALVSVVTAVSLFFLFPLLMQVKVRELFLIKKAWDLDHEVRMIKQQNEASWHVRILVQEIRKSLDRHTILYTTLEKLSETLDLQNCAIWMPNDSKTEMNLTHCLKSGNISAMHDPSIPIRDFDVRQIKECDGVKILAPDSALAARSCGGNSESGTVAAIRMRMLRVSDFNGGTDEVIQACYAILVLVRRSGNCRSWGIQEIEIVKVVADQVAVALSHAVVLEESQLVREKLADQNQALQQAKKDAVMASQARNSFQMVMSIGLREPMHSIMGLLSMLQTQNLRREQQILVNAMVKTSNVLPALINDVMDTLPRGRRFPVEIQSFRLRAMIKEAACVVKSLCAYRGYGFAIEVEKSLPDYVMGDEIRVFQVILHLVGSLLKECSEGGCLTLRVFSVIGSQGRNDHRRGTSTPNSSDGYVYVKFEIGINNNGPHLESFGDQYWSRGIEEGLSFSACRILVQMMQGDIWVVPYPVGFDQSMALVLRFQLRPSIVVGISEIGDSTEHPNSNSLFRGLQVMLADHDNVNLAVTKKLLQKLGCIVSTVSTGYECLGALDMASSPFQVVLMDLHMPDLDGYEFAIRIQVFKNRGWPMIIALSASDDEDVWGKCLSVGYDGLVQKPVLLLGIANELRRVLLQANSSI